MIALKSKIDRNPNTMVEQQLSQDGRFGWFLAVWHPERDHALQELTAEIRLAIRNSEAASISKGEVESWLKSFMGDLHWKMHAFLRKTDLQEKGMSLFFGILYDHELFFVQYGRIFCSLSDGKKLSHIGNQYQHHQMQTLSKLNLLGYEDRDISTKVQRLFIGEGQRFVVLSGNLCAKVYGTQSDLNSLDHYIESFSNAENPLWLILEGKSRLLKPKRKRMSRLQVTSFIILLITLGAVVYMMFGNRFLDQFFHRIRMTVKGNKSLRLEQIPNTLAIDSKDFLKYMERIVNLPARDIELQIIWSASLQYSITGAPVFSLDTIFLTADNNLIAFDKKSRKLKWKKYFDAPISSVLYMDNALMVCLQSDSASAFSEDGTLLWEADMTCPAQASVNLNPLRISGDDDPRLDRPILMIPSREVISIVDAGRGESLSSITFVDDIAAISAYDNFANCFYAIVDDALICIQLKIVN